MLVDPRIDAGADLDGVLFGGTRRRRLSRPFMLMSAEPGFAADPNRAGFWSRLRGPHYAVDIKAPSHFAFSDLVFFAPRLIRANPSAGGQSSGRERRRPRHTRGRTCLSARLLRPVPARQARAAPCPRAWPLPGVQLTSGGDRAAVAAANTFRDPSLSGVAALPG